MQGAELESLLHLLGPDQHLHGLVKEALLHEVVGHALSHLGTGPLVEILGNLVQHLVVVVLEAEVQRVRYLTSLNRDNSTIYTHDDNGSLPIPCGTAKWPYRWLLNSLRSTYRERRRETRIVLR